MYMWIVSLALKGGFNKRLACIAHSKSKGLYFDANSIVRDAAITYRPVFALGFRGLGISEAI